VKITWSLPVRGETLQGTRGDLVRARQLVEALRAGGHEVVVVEDAARPGSRALVGGYRSVARRFLPRRVALVLRDAGRVLHARAHGRHVAEAALAQGADLIVETQVGFAASGAVAHRLTGLPLVLDDTTPSREEAEAGAGVTAFARSTLRQQAHAAVRVVAVSRALAKELVAEGVPSGKILLVPNGVDLAAYARADREACRRELGLAGSVVVGFVGSFRPWHRVDLLVEALARLAPRVVRLLLVGEGPGRAAAQERAAALGVADRVTWLGARRAEDVPRLVSAFDVGALPATNAYGHPMKLVEHAAAGVASVAPDLPPVREVLEHEVTGLLFPPGDVSALARALGRLVDDAALRRRLGAAAHETIAAGADWRDRARALLDGLPPLATSSAAAPAR
jgi:glycosyltransferase involved in cell wall biosynthesis